jgi:hypothetical protein
MVAQFQQVFPTDVSLQHSLLRFSRENSSLEKGCKKCVGDYKEMKRLNVFSLC